MNDTPTEDDVMGSDFVMRWFIPAMMFWTCLMLAGSVISLARKDKWFWFAMPPVLAVCAFWGDILVTGR